MASLLIVAEHGNGKLMRATLHSLTFGREAAEKLGANLYLQLVEKAVQLATGVGREIATPEEARKILGVRGSPS